MTNNIIKKASDNMRVLAVSMVEKAKSGHPGGPMGGMDFINVLYSEFLKFNPEDMGWNNRDRFFLDAGHLSSMMYAQLSMFGKYSMEDLQREIIKEGDIRNKHISQQKLKSVNSRRENLISPEGESLKKINAKLKDG